MIEKQFSPDDISREVLEYVDNYEKKVITNAKHYFYRKQNRAKKYGIVWVELDDCEEELHSTETDFDTVFAEYINVRGIKVPVYNPVLADAIKRLTESQRVILLQNVVLGIPLKEIAVSFGISERMACRHRQNAIESIKRRMCLKHDM